MMEGALVSLDGVAPRRMVSVFASANLPLHHKVQNFSSNDGGVVVILIVFILEMVADTLISLTYTYCGRCVCPL